MSLNKAMLIGNVGKDPEVRYLEGNTPNAKMASFTLATTERYRDRNGELRENTEWHNIIAWRNNADVVEKYVRKGTQLFIEGRIRTRSWDDQTGNKHYITEIVADNLQLLGKKSDNPATQQSQNQTFTPQQPQAPTFTQQQPYPTQPKIQQPIAPSADIDDNPDDDLPF